MNNIFDDEEGLPEIDTYNGNDEEVDFDNNENSFLDARRRLEKRLEEKLLERELDDFADD